MKHTSTELTTQIQQLATKFNMGNGEGEGVKETLKATVFKGNISDDIQCARLAFGHVGIYDLAPPDHGAYAQAA